MTTTRRTLLERSGLAAAGLLLPACARTPASASPPTPAEVGDMLDEKVLRIYSAGDHTQGLSSGIPLLVLDMYEHSYHMDYGTAAAKYIDAFFANLHWEEVDRRSEVALRVAEAFP